MHYNRPLTPPSSFVVEPGSGWYVDQFRVIAMWNGYAEPVRSFETLAEAQQHCDKLRAAQQK